MISVVVCTGNQADLLKTSSSCLSRQTFRGFCALSVDHGSALALEISIQAHGTEAGANSPWQGTIPRGYI
jgi:hypothetical protein